MAISKRVRVQVLTKYGGHCAYCGDLLKHGSFHIDHIIPKSSFRAKGFDIDHIDNLNPACAKCNLFKDCFTVEQFRKNLSRQVDVALRNSTPFQRAIKWGQVTMTKHPILFWFERGDVRSI